MSEGSSGVPASGQPAGESGPGQSPDPSRIASPADFGRELTLARVRTGLAVRDLAARAKVPAGTVSGYLTGAHLPQPTFLDPFRRVLDVVDEGDPERLRQWEEALLRVRRTPGKRSGSVPSPYPGLRSFQPQDAALFRGRTEVTEEIVRRVQARAAETAAGRGPLMVVGASGAGKSSLLRAGVIPALRELGFETELTVPGARALARLEQWSADPADGVHRALIIDQFEDTFARGPSELPEQRLVDGLANLGARTVAVLGMRADFYLNALLHPLLAAALQHDQVIVSPMTPAELRHAIVDPAKQLGYDVDPSLVELILRDLNPRMRGEYEQAAHDAGALPFLSHALHSTWERSRGRRLTVNDYLSAGGVERSIAQAADSVFAELTEPQRVCARRLLLRLVRAEEDLRDTRRRVPLSEIVEYDGGLDAEDTQYVLSAFVAARLLTINNDRAEITHDAFLDAWPRLSAWIDEYRAAMRLHHRITEAANNWRMSGRDPESLYRGGLLQVAAEWIDSGYAGELNKLETEFYEASLKARRASELRERYRLRRRYTFAALLTVLVVIAAGLAGFALHEHDADRQQVLQTQSRYAANESNQLRDIDVSVSMQLALAAYRISPTPEARAALMDSTDAEPGTRVMLPGDPLTAMTVGGPDDDVLATGTTNGPVQLWTIIKSSTDIARSASLPAPGGTIRALTFNHDGSLLAAGDTSGRIHLWQASTSSSPQPLPTLAVPGASSGKVSITSLKISPTAPILAAGTSTGQILLWNIADPTHSMALTPLTGLPKADATLGFSADGTMLADGAGTTVQLWNTSTRSAATLISQIDTGNAGLAYSVAISPDLTTLAVGVSEAHSVLLWNITDPAHPRSEPELTGPTSWVNTVAFSPDGADLAAGSSDGMVWIYDLATHTVVAKLPHPRPVDEIDYRADGSLLSFADDGTVRSWPSTGPVITNPTDTVFALDFDKTGTEMVIGDGSNDDTETLWNVTDTQNPRELGVIHNPDTGTAFSGSGVLSPNGELLAIGDLDGTVQLWNVADPEHPVSYGSPFKASNALVESLTLSSRGTILAVTDDEGTTPLYDISDPHHPRLLSTLPAQTPGSYTYQADFSSTDQLLAVESSDNHAYLWNIANPRHPTLDKKLGGFTAAAYSAVFFDDNTYLAVGSADSTVRIWNISTPRSPAPVGRPLTGPIGYIYDLAYDPQQHLLADPGSTDGSVWLWDMTDPARPTLVADLTGPADGVLADAFGPDGAILVAGGHDHSVHLWNTGISATETWICQVAGQDITPQEWAQYVPGAAYNPPCPAKSES